MSCVLAVVLLFVGAIIEVIGQESGVGSQLQFSFLFAECLRSTLDNVVRS